MTTNLHYLIAGMAVLLVVLWQYSHQRQMDDRNSLMFRRLLTVVSLDVLAELVSTCFILYAPYSFGVGRMLSNTVFYLFQAVGIGLCLDDFGSGYANLNTVMQLPFSVIKLDRSLLFHICTDKNAALFYQSIVSAFCRLGYRIIAEGVETQEEMELLRSWNVDMIQGYYFSRPLPPGDLLRLLTEEAVEQM